MRKGGEGSQDLPQSPEDCAGRHHRLSADDRKEQRNYIWKPLVAEAVEAVRKGRDRDLIMHLKAPRLGRAALRPLSQRRHLWEMRLILPKAVPIHEQFGTTTSLLCCDGPRLCLRHTCASILDCFDPRQRISHTYTHGYSGQSFCICHFGTI